MPRDQRVVVVLRLITGIVGIVPRWHPLAVQHKFDHLLHIQGAGR